MKKLTVILFFGFSLIIVVNSHAESGSHAIHGMQHPSTASSTDVPKSGKAREGGYLGVSNMRSTALKEGNMQRCEQARLGIIMLENVEWEKCGGKISGIPENVTATKNRAQHQHAH